MLNAQCSIHMAQSKKKTKGPQPKHIPQRMCISCRQSDTKRGLLRLVREQDGRIALDPTGKRAGRGAYLCHDSACWAQALKRGGLVRALRVETVHPDDQEALERFAAELAAKEPVAGM